MASAAIPSLVSHVVVGLSFPVEPGEDRADNKHHKQKYSSHNQASEQYILGYLFLTLQRSTKVAAHRA
jgi:hypothetical protein